MVSWWLVVKKQEMTRLWVDGKQVPVTLFVVPEQEVVQRKTDEKDWYSAVVVWVEKKVDAKKEKGRKVSFSLMTEFRDLPQSDDWAPTVAQLEDVDTVTVTAISKGKGFQWVMKRHNFSWGPATHGSKFHRAAWSTGAVKPRRTIKGREMAWRMGWDRVTLKKVTLVDVIKNGDETIVALKGSVPGAYNAPVRLSII